MIQVGTNTENRFFPHYQNIHLVSFVIDCYHDNSNKQRGHKQFPVHISIEHIKILHEKTLKYHIYSCTPIVIFNEKEKEIHYFIDANIEYIDGLFFEEIHVQLNTF